MYIQLHCLEKLSSHGPSMDDEKLINLSRKNIILCNLGKLKYSNNHYKDIWSATSNQLNIVPRKPKIFL